MERVLLPKRKIVWRAPGALYGYCPKCGAPGEMRERNDGKGKDRCQRKHTYATTLAVWRPEN